MLPSIRRIVLLQNVSPPEEGTFFFSHFILRYIRMPRIEIYAYRIYTYIMDIGREFTIQSRCVIRRLQRVIAATQRNIQDLRRRYGTKHDCDIVLRRRRCTEGNTVFIEEKIRQEFGDHNR